VLALAGQPRQAEALLNAMKPSLGASRYDLASSWLADVEGDVDKAVALLESHLGDRTGAIQWATVQLKNKKQPGSWVPLLKHQLTADEWAQLAAPAELQQLWLASTYCYEQALKLDPNNPKLLNNWAWSAMNLKEFDREKVLDAVRRSYAAFSKNPAVLDTYAEALLRTTQYRECVDLLNANLSVTRRTPQLLLLLAKAYEANNDLENSLRTYRQVLDLQTRTKDWDLRMGRDALSQQIHKLESKVN
jgi:predicted Zn-dependent protease